MSPPSTGTFVAALALWAATSGVAAQELRNVTTGAPLRPGIYGRIEVRGSTPPPVFYAKPVVASDHRAVVKAPPVYLYVPPGQVRKWQQHCAKWQACDEPVLFVRMEASPSRWGEWRQLRDQVAWQGGAARH